MSRKNFLFLILLVTASIGSCSITGDKAALKDTTFDNNMSESNDANTRQEEKISCERIISLAPSITETLFALGLGDRVVGVTKYCKYPKEASLKPIVGGYVDPAIETMLTLNPSVVMLLPEHEGIAKHIKTLGIPTVSLRHHSTLEILESISTIGKICGTKTEAESLLFNLQAQIELVKNATRKLPPVRTMITMGRNMGTEGINDVFLAGKTTYYNDLIEMAGGVNAYTGEVPVPMVSREGIIGMNPELIVDMVPKTDQESTLPASIVAADWGELPVDAVKNGRVFIIEESYAVVPGPRFVEILKDLARMMHGLEF